MTTEAKSQETAELPRFIKGIEAVHEYLYSASLAVQPITQAAQEFDSALDQGNLAMITTTAKSLHEALFTSAAPIEIVEAYGELYDADLLRVLGEDYVGETDGR